MLLVGFLNAGAAAGQVLKAGRLCTDHVEDLPVVEASLVAFDVI